MKYVLTHRQYRFAVIYGALSTWTPWLLGHSTLNVEPKYLTSPIFLKFCVQLPLDITWWNAKFENDWITFRALFARGPKISYCHVCTDESMMYKSEQNRSNWLRRWKTEGQLTLLPMGVLGPKFQSALRGTKIFVIFVVFFIGAFETKSFAFSGMGCFEIFWVKCTG